MKEIAILLVAILAICVAENMWLCSNMKHEHGKSMITMMNSGETMKLSCLNNKMHQCKWWHHNAAMPDRYGNIEIGSKETMKITKPTVHNSGSYTLDMGTTTETHHIIVMPTGHMRMVIEGHHIHGLDCSMDSALTFSNYHIHDTVFCHVDWYDTHWHRGMMYNMTFNHNIFIHHMNDHMMFHNHHYDVIPCHDFKHDVMTLEHWMMKDDLPMHAEFHHCHFINTIFKNMHMYNKLVQHVIFDNVHFTNMHFHKMHFEDHMKHDFIHFCVRHPHHLDCVHMMSGCLHCYHDNEGGFPQNRHHHHYWKIKAFEQIHDDAYYTMYHTPNTHHTEKQHCLQYDVVVYINHPHYVVKVIFTKDDCRYDTDKLHDVSMFINILNISLALMIIYIRPERPVREERDEDEGDLPFPIPVVGPD